MFSGYIQISSISLNTIYLFQRFSHQTIRISHNNESWAGDHILWYRNPLDLIRNLFANPLFKQEIVYAPEKHFSNDGKRLYSEINWSDWWWRIQVFNFIGYLKI